MTVYDFIWSAANACYQFGYQIGDALANFLF